MIAATFAEPLRVPPLWLIVVIPLLAASVNLFGGRRLGRWAGWFRFKHVIM